MVSSVFVCTSHFNEETCRKDFQDTLYEKYYSRSRLFNHDSCDRVGCWNWVIKTWIKLIETFSLINKPMWILLDSTIYKFVVVNLNELYCDCLTIVTFLEVN